jgi:hypothetical protein
MKRKRRMWIRKKKVVLSFKEVIFIRPFLLQSVQALPLNLVVEIEITLVEVVDTDVTVLSSTGVATAGRVGSNGVEGTEVTTDTANLVFENLVVESGLESTLAAGGCGDFHGGLTTSQNDEVLLGADCGAVERGVCRVGLEGGEIASRDELLKDHELVRHTNLRE